MNPVVKSSLYSPVIVDNDHDTMCPYTITMRQIATYDL